MNLKHKIYYIAWAVVSAFVITGSKQLRKEYEQDCAAAWEMQHAAIEFREWLHRRWFPHKYSYEAPRGY